MRSFQATLAITGGADIELEVDVIRFEAPNGDEFQITLDGERHMQITLTRDKDGRMGPMALLAKSSNVMSLRSSFEFDQVVDYMHLPPDKGKTDE